MFSRSASYASLFGFMTFARSSSGERCEELPPRSDEEFELDFDIMLKVYELDYKLLNDELFFRLAT